MSKSCGTINARNERERQTKECEILSTVGQLETPVKQMKQKSIKIDQMKGCG